MLSSGLSASDATKATLKFGTKHGIATFKALRNLGTETAQAGLSLFSVKNIVLLAIGKYVGLPAAQQLGAKGSQLLKCLENRGYCIGKVSRGLGWLISRPDALSRKIYTNQTTIKDLDARVTTLEKNPLLAPKPDNELDSESDEDSLSEDQKELTLQDLLNKMNEGFDKVSNKIDKHNHKDMYIPMTQIKEFATNNNLGELATKVDRIDERVKLLEK